MNLQNNSWKKNVRQRVQKGFLNGVNNSNVMKLEDFVADLDACNQDYGKEMISPT
ncbi:MAG: hypothetical protein EZS28_049036, partial [Streblomastix strix]